jgi:hypothetical protein
MTKHPATLTREIVASALAELAYSRPIAADEITDEMVTELGHYLLTITSQHETRHGVAWHAIITRDGETVLDVRDEGNGGCLWFESQGRYVSDIAGVPQLVTLAEVALGIFPTAIEPASSCIMLLDILSEARRDHATLIVA